MTKEEIENGNRLIAEFCNLTLLKADNPGQIDIWHIDKDSVTPLGYSDNVDTIWMLRYHEYWDWLMPVVMKIESEQLHDDFSVEIIECVCDIKKFSNMAEGYQTFIKKLGKSKIEATWICVVELIKYLRGEEEKNNFIKKDD